MKTLLYCIDEFVRVFGYVSLGTILGFIVLIWLWHKGEKGKP